MHDESKGKRLILGACFALALAALVAFANPAERIKADLSADANGFVLSLEYSAKAMRL